MLGFKSLSIKALICAISLSSVHSASAAVIEPRNMTSSVSSAPATITQGDLARIPMIKANATARYLRFQPSMDFDTDSCYNWPAITFDGDTCGGLPTAPKRFPARYCRDESDLDNNNGYARRRCNRGWCAYIYAYYFPKDVGEGGHRHDWEHVAVWTKAGKINGDGSYGDESVVYIGTSAHGDFEMRHVGRVEMDMFTHPKVVYHLGGVGSHSIRFAKKQDDKIENHKGVWFRGPLVSWEGFPSWKKVNIRQKLLDADFGSAHLALKDGDFTRALIATLQSAPQAKSGEFDCAFDEEPATSQG